MSILTAEPAVLPIRRPNKLRKPPPNPGLSHVLHNRHSFPTAVTATPSLHLDDNEGSCSTHTSTLSSIAFQNSISLPAETPPFPPPSPSVASAHTVSAASHIPLLHDYRPSLPARPEFVSSKKLTKRRPSLPSLPSNLYAQITYHEQLQHTPPGRPLDVPPPATRPRRATLTFSLLGRKRGESQPSAVRESLSRWGRWPGRTSQNEPPRETESSFADAVLSSDVPPKGAADDIALHGHACTQHSGPIAGVAWTGLVTSEFIEAQVDLGDFSPWKSTWSLDELHTSQSLTKSPDPPERKVSKFSFWSDDDQPTVEIQSPESSLGHSDASRTPSSPVRPRIVRRHAGVDIARRWTLAMAMADEGITDEVLLAELERVRLRRADGNALEAGVWESSRRLPLTPPLTTIYLSEGAFISNPSSSALPPTWLSARQALLICRELVRTERHYLSSLRSLLTGQTATPPPPTMLGYVTELEKVSDSMLSQMEEDPSAHGLSLAFVCTEDSLEGAFVAWCGVVGMWFTSGEGNGTRHRRKLSKSRPVGDDLSSPSSLGRSQSTWRRSLPSMPAFTGPASALLVYGDRPWKSSRGDSSPTKPQRSLSIRDLAILPTQRVTRYVLLYRDLLSHTPTSSPSYSMVKRALDTASRVAQKCDDAQVNAAFIQR